MMGRRFGDGVLCVDGMAPCGHPAVMSQVFGEDGKEVEGCIAVNVAKGVALVNDDYDHDVVAALGCIPERAIKGKFFTKCMVCRSEKKLLPYPGTDYIGEKR